MTSPSEPRIQVDEALQKSYDEYYAQGESAWRALGARSKAENIIRMCASVPHARVVDIGAGEGAVSAELARRGFSSQIHCLEISDSGVEVIRSRDLAAVTEVRKFDGYHMPYPDGHFDLAFASHVLEHVEHERTFLYEARRLARHLFIEVPLLDTLRLPEDFVPDRVGHINFYNRKTIRHLLQSSGLEVIDQRLFGAPLAVQRAVGGRVAGTARFLARGAIDLASRRLAARLFVYHCGLLCRPGKTRDSHLFPREQASRSRFRSPNG